MINPRRLEWTRKPSFGSFTVSTRFVTCIFILGSALIWLRSTFYIKYANIYGEYRSPDQQKLQGDSGSIESIRRQNSSLTEDKTLTDLNTAILIVSDTNSRSRFKIHTDSVACYARRFDYEFHLLDPADSSPICHENHKDFFFRKHCTVREWLRTQPYGRRALVLDGDNVGGTSDVPLEKWFDVDDFDVAFYERSWNSEITAGNYLLRNTPFTHAFLQAWANYEYFRPNGFTSSDNGAIHMVLLDALAISGRAGCLDLYRALSIEVSQADNLDRYYDMVACSRKLLGPPRTHLAFDAMHREDNLTRHGNAGKPETLENAEKNGSIPVAKITIFPKFFGFSVDTFFFGYYSKWLHPFQHGVKEGAKAIDTFNMTIYSNQSASTNRSGCVGMPKRLHTPDQFIAHLRTRDNETLYAHMGFPWGKVPRWEHEDKNCYVHMWCPPLPSNKTGDWPRAIVSTNGSFQDFFWTDPGHDWFNPLALSHDHHEIMD